MRLLSAASVPGPAFEADAVLSLDGLAGGADKMEAERAADADDVVDVGLHLRRHAEVVHRHARDDEVGAIELVNQLVATVRASRISGVL
jgi:hypothetical protein